MKKETKIALNKPMSKLTIEDKKILYRYWTGEMDSAFYMAKDMANDINGKTFYNLDDLKSKTKDYVYEIEDEMEEE